jgi:hypothetical protein
MSLKPEHPSGISDVYVGGKYMLHPHPQRFNIGVGSGVWIPAGSAPIGEDKPTVQAFTQMSYQVGKRFWGMTLLPVTYSDYKHERHWVSKPFSILGMNVGQKQAIGMLYSGNFYQDIKPKTRVGAAWIYKPSKASLFVIEATHGLDEGAHRYQLEAQYMHRIDLPWSRFY